VQGDNGGSDTTFKCVSPAAVTCLGTEAITIPCSDSGQCQTGDVCCGTTDQAGNYGSVQCASSCNASGEYIFCDPNATPDICATLGNGSTCMPSQILPGYSVCESASVGQ
jgi:hypothetical protein